MPSLCGSKTSSVVATNSPNGANVSQALPRCHCPSANWKSRADTSWKLQYPSTWSIASSRETRDARRPTTTPSSASKSVSVLPFGITMVPPGASTQLGNLLKISGRSGSSAPCSSA